MQLRDFSGFVLIRHATVADKRILCGRTDCDIAPISAAFSDQARAVLSEIDVWICSPARRCQHSYTEIFGSAPAPQQCDERLWEQDFGEWEGSSYADLPDIGNLSGQQLADFTPPGGESFSELAIRTREFFDAYSEQAQKKPIGIMAHAGVIRSFIGHALGDASLGLSFVISELSITQIGVYSDTQFAVAACNQRIDICQ